MYDNHRIIIYNDTIHTHQQFAAILQATFNLSQYAVELLCKVIHRAGCAHLDGPLEHLEFQKERLEGYGFKCQIERRLG